MAVPSYTSDLLYIHACDAASASWTEPAEFAAGAIALPEVDYFIQNTGCLSKNMGTATNAASGAIYNYGSGLTITSPNVFMMWLFFGAPNALATQANGGLVMFMGSSATAYKKWHVRGSNTYPYGGWVCVPVDPNTTADTTTGAPTATKQYFGAAAVLSGVNAVSKGNPFALDAVCYGRAEARINGGETGNYATFSGFAATNDLVANRWGLIQSVDGSYLWQGLLVLGYTTLVNFIDANKSIIVANTEKVTSGFNKIEIRQATSNVQWSAISFLALGTVSRGDFQCVDNATVTITNCVFTNMGTFIFQSNSAIDGCTFRSCNLVTRGNATITDSLFETTNDSTKALLLRDPTRSLTGCTFVAPPSGNTKHAIEITEIGTYTFTNNTFTNYASSNGSVGTEVILNSSGGLVTIQHSGTNGTISYMNTGVGSTTAVTGSVAITITVKDESDVNINGAYVYIVDSGSTEVMNTTTSSGQATGSYTGAYSNGTLRVRKYGYKPFAGSVSLSTTVNQTVVLIADPVQDASPQNLSSHYTINTTAKTITSVGTATYSVKEYFKWLANTFAAASYMDDTFPMLADTDVVFRFTNSWTFGTPTTDYKYLNGGAITSSDSTKIWSNIYTIGSLISGTTLDVYQNDTQFTPWWSSDHIDILVLVKDTTAIDSSNITILGRKYSTLYDHTIVNAPSGRNPVPLAAFTDLNNQTAEGTVGAYSGFTFTFGYANKDLNNTNGPQPYDCVVECNYHTISEIYEYLKYVTRTGSSTTLNGVNGEYYTGVGDIRFNYSGASGGSGYFTQTSAITDTTTSATGYIVSETHSGATGTVVIRNTHGTFSNTNAISSGGVTATISSVPVIISQSKQAPFGTFAGGQFFGARGVWLDHVASTDANNYELIDSTGTTQAPPNTVATTITVQDLATGLDIEGANVLVWVTNNANYFYQASVSITGSGTTATVTHTAHGLTTGEYVIIKGVTNDDDYNGVFQITYLNVNQYTYTATETLDASPATGASITSTFAIINGSTNSSGLIDDSRSLSANQPVAGWVRKSSGTPYYQQGTISGTIDSNSGLSITLQLARDE